MRSATLDLDSVYGFPAPRIGPEDEDRGGHVARRNNSQRAPAAAGWKGRRERSAARCAQRRSALRPRRAHRRSQRNDENTIVAQLHLAFLLAHNELVDQGLIVPSGPEHSCGNTISGSCSTISFARVCRPGDRAENHPEKAASFYRAMDEPFFLPLEFAVAAFRFGHTMVRAGYDFNVNFNTSGAPSVGASLDSCSPSPPSADSWASGRRLRHAA